MSRGLNRRQGQNSPFGVLASPLFHSSDAVSEKRLSTIWRSGRLQMRIEANDPSHDFSDLAPDLVSENIPSKDSILTAGDRVVRARDGRDPACCRSIHLKPAATGDGSPKGNRAGAQRLPGIGSK